MKSKAYRFVEEHFKDSIRVRGNTKHSLELPFPYNAPCAIGLFDDLFYWDTYFANLANYELNNYEQALNNLKDFKYLIERYGFIPNSANTGLLNRSQPPLYIMMCSDYYEHTKDINFIKEFLPSMELEYSFWMKERSFKNGLNFYRGHPTDDFCIEHAKNFKERVKNFDTKNLTDIQVGLNALAECESGWDFSPRFAHKATECVPIDLNSFLYFNEVLLGKFCDIAGKPNNYLELANKRLSLLKALKFDGIYYDFNIKDNEPSNYVSCASFLPFMVGIDSNKNDIKKLLKKLEFKHGISTGENKEFSNVYQWHFPNMWPPLVYFCYKALKKVGLDDDARRVKTKFIKVIESEYLKTGNLWEKYDAITGKKAAVHEYSETQMLGWTAGVYMYLKNN